MLFLQKLDITNISNVIFFKEIAYYPVRHYLCDRHCNFDNYKMNILLSLLRYFVEIEFAEDTGSRLLGSRFNSLPCVPTNLGLVARSALFASGRLSG